jgi:hypothetical protein
MQCQSEGEIWCVNDPLKTARSLDQIEPMNWNERKKKSELNATNIFTAVIYKCF